VPGQYYLVNARWYSFSGIGMSNEDTFALHEECLDQVKHGYEVSRSNSNGLTEMTQTTIEAFRQGSILPRSNIAVHFFQQEKKWNCIYISPDNKEGRKAVAYPYSQPQKGGTFDMPNETFNKYSALSQMMKRKIQTALVLDFLRKKNFVCASMNATIDVLNQLEEARGLLHAGYQSEGPLLTILNAFNKHTLMLHPVSYHFDHYKKMPVRQILRSNFEIDDAVRDELLQKLKGSKVRNPTYGMTSLENRALFKIRCPERKKGLKGIGRGGGGKGVYVYALLDWGDTPAGRRRRLYTSLGGDPSLTLTQTRMDGFLASGDWDDEQQAEIDQWRDGEEDDR